MICPRWVSVKAQPIAVEDVLAYPVAAAEAEASEVVVCETGGPDVVSCGDIPRGLLGLLSWGSLLPAHALIFRGMLGRIAATAGGGCAPGCEGTESRTRRVHSA
jgi:hypothetical protein